MKYLEINLTKKAKDLYTILDPVHRNPGSVLLVGLRTTHGTGN